ncbi:copper chaperone CopZ [Salinicoccus hispanicus]|uniref:Copper chaperone CopZ n=1 Tax=Salinicoccus hispanicus TaxID=157225 RepID=A0A6N8U574_9STAP|nr:copper chaperone CopZ [Salinicoccus hispanicus]MXQ51635.1 copper chaperone CopZ [Salinicoccus hispanicus]
MENQIIKVEGMTCGHCKSSVEGALNKLDGVDSATVSLEDNQVAVQYDASKVSNDALNDAIEDQGYDVVK